MSLIKTLKLISLKKFETFTSYKLNCVILLEEQEKQTPSLS